MSRLRIVIADDHRMMADGLRALLETQYEIAAIVEDGWQLIEAALEAKPDLILADIAMPLLNGLDAVEELRARGCQAKFIFLTMHKDALYAARALRAGASGFLLKHSAGDELLSAIETAVGGGTYVTAEVAETLQRSAPRAPAEEVPLTRRQREVLQLFAEGHSAKEVAKILHISPRTAEGHKAQIMALLEARSTAELVQAAVRLGLVKFD